MRRNIRIHIYFATLLIAVTLVIGFTVAALSYVRMKAALIGTAAETFDRAANAVDAQVRLDRAQIRSWLEIAILTDIASAKSFKARIASLDILGTALRSNPLVSAAYIGYPDGAFFLLRRLPPFSEAHAFGAPSQTAFVLQSVDRSRSVWGQYRFYDVNLREIGVRDEPGYRFDPRTRPWYAAASSSVQVTPPYVFFSTKELGQTFSVLSPSGSVFGADVTLTSISAELARLRPTPGSVCVMIDQSGTVVGYSDLDLFAKLIRSGSGKVVTLSDLASPPLAAALAAQPTPASEVKGTFRDPNGRTWFYAASAAARDQGNHRRLLLAVPEDELLGAAERVRTEALYFCLGMVVVLIPLTAWLSSFIRRPIGALRHDALALRNLDFSERLAPQSFITEISEFSETFGQMRRQMNAFNEAALRFVPREFLENLGRIDFKSLELGDHTERRMTILFSDIRAFTTLSGNMSPQQTFNFINSYLTRVGPIIREHGGFIDKYIGDAIMGLFPDRRAVEAAIAMQRRVVVYNQERARAGYEPIAIGIGLHRGDLMLGTIGETLRFETTVIADAVNIASRLESLTKTFHCLILVSGEVLADTDPAVGHPRYLCDARVKGATHPVALYEICDADPPDLFDHKRRTMRLFEEGRRAYAAGQFAEAERIFGEIASSDERDAPAHYFCRRAAMLAAAEAIAHWDGVEEMESK